MTLQAKLGLEEGLGQDIREGKSHLVGASLRGRARPDLIFFNAMLQKLVGKCWINSLLSSGQFNSHSSSIFDASSSRMP